ncbi:NHLP bacteriocin system secretion protein [Candidatus Palauibacter sp.]|uniref:NHLP bacteriocin system secretion protein n=1 Tax=Candidatus Palauibacter sp. TaxID=3101350 RepID=UPI003AF22B76
MSERSGKGSSGNARTERLGTPEHLDRVLYVTTPRAWLALGALVAILTAAVVWSIVGQLSTYVRAEGIILSRSGMVLDVVSSRGGRLNRIGVATGDRVEVEDVVAETFDPEVMERYTGALAAADERLRALRDREAEAAAENVLFEQNVADQRERLGALQEAAEEMVARARERLRNFRELAERGIVTQTAVENSAQSLDAAQSSLFEVMRRRDQLEADELRRRSQINESITSAQVQHMEAQRQVNELAAVIETWKIRSTVSGRVTEIKTQVGATLGAGQAVLSVESGETGLDVLMYVSPADGKRVEAGMAVLVSPSTVRREEYGAMTGTVESLSEFPASLEGIVAVLQNQDLAASFSSNGPPYPGRVVLDPDGSTASGFAWTSSRGVAVDITPGTLASVEIRVESQPPIALAMPWLRELLSM